MRWLAVLALLVGCDYAFRLDELPDIPDAPADAAIVGRWSDVATGIAHTCALDDARQLWCWGRNEDGQTGAGLATRQIDAPTRIGDAAWTRVRTYANTTCALREDATMWCWGHNSNRQIGDGTNNDRLVPHEVAGGAWLDVSPGLLHTCAVKADHTLWCWGANGAGQIGNGTMTLAETPVQVTTPAIAWESVSAGDELSCAVATDGGAWCWGANDTGELGNGTMTPSPMPVRLGTDTWRSVAAGVGFACGITTDGRLWCWGDNRGGQLASTVTTRSLVPIVVATDGETRTDWEQVVVGLDQACARTTAGDVYCWGASVYGQLGVVEQYVRTPRRLDERTWSRIATGGRHSCFIGSDRALFCVGNNGYAQLGDGGSSSTVPVRVPGTWVAMSVGNTHTCAVDDAGTVACAGANLAGELASSPRMPHASMTAVPGGPYTSVEAAHLYTCAIDGGTVYCWGANYNGQLGIGTLGNEFDSPRMVRAGRVVRGHKHTCTIAPGTNQLYCWGLNDAAQVGTGSASTMPTGIATPTLVQGITALEVGTGEDDTCVIEGAESHVFCWGAGQPTPTAGDTGLVAAQLSVGGFHRCAISAAGTMSCWGFGYGGQLGLGDFGPRTTPTALPGSWRSVAAAYTHTCAVRDDGTLWCWGYNDAGQLGIGTRIDVNVPTQVGTDTDWAEASGWINQTCARKTTNELWCWGSNYDGLLADGRGWSADFVQVP